MPTTPSPSSSSYSIVPLTAVNEAAVETLWDVSQEADGAVMRARGPWSLTRWASMVRWLKFETRLIGIVALTTSSPEGLAEGRLALLPEYRSSEAAKRLVEAALELAREARAERLRLYLGGTASWAKTAVASLGFDSIRATYRMLFPADAEVPEAEVPSELRIRPIRPNEDARVLQALNRTWADTWNFRPIQPAALAADLVGQRRGFLLAVERVDDTSIAGTVHAIFDRHRTNPDGGPHAWISNVTTDPAWRGRGVARGMLTAGLRQLRSRGGKSVALGVDAGNPIPLGLYLSTGFNIISSVELWDRTVSGK